MPRPDLDAIRKRQETRWMRLLSITPCEHNKTDGMLNDLDALLSYVDELEGERAAMRGFTAAWIHQYEGLLPTKAIRTLRRVCEPKEPA